MIVVTGFPYYPTGSLYPGTKMAIWSREIIENVNVLRLPLYPDHSRSIIRRALNYSSFSFSIAVLGSLLSGPVDILYVEHPSTMFGLAAWLMSRLRRAPFMYLVDDIWPESVEASGMLRHPMLLAGIECLEQFVYKGASAITVVSQANRDRLLAKGVPTYKVHYVPHYANEEIYRPVIPNPIFREKLGLTGRFTIMFAGHVGMAQGLDVVLAAARELTDLPEVLFLIVGDGPDADRLKRIVQAQGLINVRFLDRQPMERMPCLFALADGLLVHLRDTPVFRSTIPSKTIAYMACGRPIIMALEGEAADLIHSSGAGMTCPPEDHKRLAEAVRGLHRMSPEARAAMGQAGRQAFLTSYTRAAVLSRYEMLLMTQCRNGRLSSRS